VSPAVPRRLVAALYEAATRQAGGGALLVDTGQTAWQGWDGQGIGTSGGGAVGASRGAVGTNRGAVKRTHTAWLGTPARGTVGRRLCHRQRPPRSAGPAVPPMRRGARPRPVRTATVPPAGSTGRTGGSTVPPAGSTGRTGGWGLVLSCCSTC